MQVLEKIRAISLDSSVLLNKFLCFTNMFMFIRLCMCWGGGEERVGGEERNV